jgi:photosystem II stability/assembly factor-like uncharacterized protein
MANAHVFALAQNDTFLFAGTAAGVVRTSDHGDSWMDVRNGLTNDNIDALLIDGPSIFAGSARNFYGGVLTSSDNGTDWITHDNGMTNLEVYSLAVFDTYLFAGTYSGGIFRSLDKGISWTEANTGLTNDTVEALAVYGPYLFAGTYNSNPPYLQGGYEAGVFRSSDNGTSWEKFRNSLINTNVFAIIGFGPYIFAGTDCCGVFRSADSGVTWNAVANGMTSYDVLAFAVSGSDLFAGTSGGGVFRSKDSGASWTEINSGLTYPYVSSLVVKDSNLFAGTLGAGVYRRPLSDFEISDVATRSIPSKTELRSYPNPLSQSTTISFTLEASGYADISIVNLLGIEVAHLFSGELNAGDHSFPWSKPTGLPNGAYECELRMNGESAHSLLIVQ